VGKLCKLGHATLKGKSRIIAYIHASIPLIHPTLEKKNLGIACNPEVVFFEADLILESIFKTVKNKSILTYSRLSLTNL